MNKSIMQSKNYTCVIINEKVFMLFKSIIKQLLNTWINKKKRQKSKNNSVFFLFYKIISSIRFVILEIDRENFHMIIFLYFYFF